MHTDNPRRFTRPKHLRLVRPGMGASDSDTDMWARLAAAYFTSGGSEAARAGSSPGGTAPGAAQQPGFAPATTISPNIQAQISPQISPTFIQSSGGGTQTGSATQYQPGGQSAQGGGTGTAPQSPVSSPGLLTGAPSPLVGAGTPSYTASPQFTPSVIQNSAPSWLIPVVAIIAIGAVGYALYKNRR